MLNRIKDRKIWARVHFIPDLKVGEFVTLRTPNVLKKQFSLAFETVPYKSNNLTGFFIDIICATHFVSESVSNDFIYILIAFFNIFKFLYVF